MVWFRIDNRLVHGQIIETWLPYTRATRLVVCNDSLSNDVLQQQIMLLAVPARIRVDFVPPAGLGKHLETARPGDKMLVIFADCADARRGYDSGAHFGNLNVGNMHYAPGKRQICAHVALSAEEASCLKDFAATGVTLDFRCVPNDMTEITEW